MYRRTLLTGAGFPCNFGLPLAKQVWSMIFNDPQIQQTKKVRGVLLKNQDYESLYSLVIGTEKFKNDKEIFLKRIDKVFNEIFESLCITAISNESTYGVSFSDLRKFINLFSGTKNNEIPYVFTVNQDLFLERLFLLSKDMLFSLYMGNCLWNFGNGSASSVALNKSHSQLLALRPKTWNNSDGVAPTLEVLNLILLPFSRHTEAGD